MRKLKVLGLLGAAALAAAFCVCLALAQSSSNVRKMDVSVDNPPPPQNSQFSCSLADNNGYVVANWTLADATYVDIDYYGHKTTDGSQGINFGACCHCGLGITATFGNGYGTTRLSCGVSLLCNGDCFLAGTQVLLADGSYKSIEDVKAGDSVMSYNMDEGKFIGASVVATTKHENDKYYIINDSMKVTTNHILMVNGQWTTASDMKVGDYLLNANGNRVAVTSIKEIEAPVEVFNLVTDEPHDFFAQNYLVHNEDEERAQKDRGLAAGMKIAMADGRELEIEKVKAGDKILTFDAKLKRYAISVVKATGKRSVTKTLLINRTLRIAKSHPMYKVPAPEGKYTIPTK
jgi:hypothetical protein